MKKAILSVTGVVVISLIAALLYFSGKEFVITIPEKTIQEKLDIKLPLKKAYLLIFDVTLDNPRVDLVEGSSRVNAGLDVVINIKERLINPFLSRKWPRLSGQSALSTKISRFYPRKFIGAHFLGAPTP